MTGFRRQLRTTIRRAAQALAPLALASALGAALVGCGGAGGDDDFGLPPGGVVGELICSSWVDPAGNQLVQGGSVTVRFRLSDANLFIPGANLPVAFEVVGGSLPATPTETDADGYAEVTFNAATDYIGVARIAMIQPDRHLRCEVSLLILEPACTLRSQVLDGANAVVAGYDFDACGLTELDLERHVARKVRYRVTAPGGPVEDAEVRLNAVGLTWTETIVHTDAAGEVVVDVTPFATGVGIASILATVVVPDDNGDGHPDHFPCNTCENKWGIIDPICDGNGGALTLALSDSFGAPQGGTTLWPGWTAEASATFLLDGVPQVGFPVLARASNGTINGSGLPQHLVTGMGGIVTVTYAPNPGFAGMDTIVIEANDNFETCSFSSTVTVETCSLDVMGAGGATSMDWGTTLGMMLHIDTGMGSPDLIGQTVSVTVTGGYLTPQLPTRMVEDDGFGNPVVPVTFTASLGFEGQAQFLVNFPGGYPCLVVSDTFTVTRP